MKRPIIIPIAILMLFCSRAKAIRYSFSDAVQKKLISISMAGAKIDSVNDFNSSHYGPCVSLDISSLSTADLDLALDYGFRLMPDDTSVQILMVTKTLIVHLSPKQKKKYRVYAMCTQAYNMGPMPHNKFKLGKRFTGNILRLAELLNRKNYQDAASQQALWCLTNEKDLTLINCSDTTEMYALRRFVASVKKIDPARIYQTYIEPEPEPQPQPKMHIRTIYSGSLSYSIIGSAKVLIALYDEGGHMKVVYVNNETQREGQYTYNYKVTSDEVGDKKHYLRMFRNGKMVDEVSIIPTDGSQ